MIRRLIATLLVMGAVFLWAGNSAAHRYAANNFDARFDGTRVDFDFMADTVSVMEVMKHLDLKAMQVNRNTAKEFRSQFYDYFLPRFSLSNNGKKCTMVNPVSYFLLHPGPDKFELKFYAECPGEVDSLTLDFSVFVETSTLNTTIGTFLGPKGGERYIFTGRASAIIATRSFGRTPRRSEDLLKNYDPSKGFLSEKDRLIALGRGEEYMAPSADPSWLPPVDGEPVAAVKMGSGFSVFVKQGISHILGGFDHVLFVITLLVGVYTWKQLALVVTSFTVAHSISLVLATLGLVRVSPALVEPIIALSIFYVAVENIVREEPRARAAVTFGFGLVHGLGFSAVLRDLGLPTDEMAPALLGFNVGVELGQLLVVAPLFPILMWMLRNKNQAKDRENWFLRASPYKKFKWFLCGGIGVLSGYWFVERIVGLITG